MAKRRQLAGAGGFEPPYAGIKIRCLTTWLRPIVPGKQVIYGDRSLKGFGVRVSGAGRISYVLPYGANRQRIKLGDVGIVKRAEEREKARAILAERQLGVHQASDRESHERALDPFLETARAKNSSIAEPIGRGKCCPAIAAPVPPATSNQRSTANATGF